MSMKEQFGNITLYNADCMDILRDMADNSFDLAIVDPPYGIHINPNMGIRRGQRKRHKNIKWDDAIPPPRIF